MEKEQQPFGIAEIHSSREVRFEIEGRTYRVKREELAQLLHGYKRRILLEEKNE